jgi:hypothetical protein
MRSGSAQNLRRCPKCGAITDRVLHCFEKGHPMFPQTDNDTMTVPCRVVALNDVLAFLRGDALPNGPMYASNLAVFVEAEFGTGD